MMDKYLKQKRIAIVVIALILLCSNLSNHIYADGIEEPKNVLIINSYHQGFTWSKDVTDGIINTFNKSGHNRSSFIEYMDWKNYPTDENIKYLYDYFKYKYQNKNIDMLIATDDAAVKFVLKNRENLFLNAPVVFAG